MQFALLSFFISKEESDLPSRTNEVVRCEERLLASCRGENTSLPSFLIHSFDEVGNKRLSAVASPSLTKNTSPKSTLFPGSLFSPTKGGEKRDPGDEVAPKCVKAN